MTKEIKPPIQMDLSQSKNTITKSSGNVIYEERTFYTLKNSLLHLASFIMIISISSFLLILSHSHRDPESLNFGSILLLSLLFLPLAYINFTHAYQYLIEKYQEKTIETKFNNNHEITQATIITRAAPKNKIYIKQSTFKINFNIDQVAFKNTKEKDADNDIIEKNEIILLSTQGDEFALLKLKNNTNKQRLLNIFAEFYGASIHPDIIVDRT